MALLFINLTNYKKIIVIIIITQIKCVLTSNGQRIGIEIISTRLQLSLSKHKKIHMYFVKEQQIKYL